MESNAKIVILCLNIFLLTIQTPRADASTPTTVSPADTTNALGRNIVSTDSLDFSAITTQNPKNSADNVPNDTNSSISAKLTSPELVDNTSDVISIATGQEQDFIDPQTLEKLLHEDNELEDLKYGGKFENIAKTIDEDDEIILPPIVENDADEPHWETEWIEEDSDSKEEEIPPIINVIAMDSKEYVFEGHIIGIVVAATLIILLVTGYVALITWRRFIVNRYGSRQILVNEEDMIDPNDMKHFSL